MARREKGVRRQGQGWLARVRVQGVMYYQTFPLNTPPAEMREWRRTTRDDHLKRYPKSAPGTLEANVQAYLKTLADRPRLQRDRARHLAWWTDRFGHRRRQSITRAEWMGAFAELRATPVTRGRRTEMCTAPRSASDIRHHRTAIFHLFTTLDGKNAPNPFREIPAPAQADPEPRALPYALIEAIFSVMPDDKYRAKLTAGQRADIAARLARRESPSHIGRAHGVAESMIRKIRDGDSPGGRIELAKAKARCRVMAYAGGLPPAQIKLLKPSDVDATTSSIITAGRKKGKGTKRVRLPIPPQGVQALQQFFAVGADGPFDTSSLNRLFQAAIARLVDRVALFDWRRARALHEQLAPATLYWLRHSYLTAAFAVSQNIRAVQVLAQHSDQRQTHRYTLAAVDPQLLELTTALGATLPGARWPVTHASR